MNESSETPPRRGKRSPGRRPLSEWGPEDTRREIRRHAVRLFNERGYAAVSIDDIASAAGVTRATLYYHYKGKADIFIESVVTVMSFVREQIEAIVRQEDRTVRERIALLVRTRRAMEGQPLPASIDDINEGMMREALMHLTPEQQTHVQRVMGELHALTHSLIALGIERGELKPLPPAVLEFTFWQLFGSDSYPAYIGLTRGETEEALLAIFFEGACP